MFKHYSNGQLMVMYLAAKKRFQQQAPAPPLALRWLCELSVALKERNCSGFQGWLDYSANQTQVLAKGIDLINTSN